MSESEQVRLFAPVDVARELRRSTSSIKRLGDELRLDVIRTGNGTRLYTLEHVAKMRAEIARRAVRESRR